MNTKRRAAISLLFLLTITLSAAAETVLFGADSGWVQTVSRGLRETDGWRGRRALTLAPLGRNPFIKEIAGPEGDLDLNDIDLLLLAELDGIDNPVGHYRITGDYEVSTLYRARGETSLRPGPGGLSLYPTARAMWSPGQEWKDFTLDFRLRPVTLRDGEIFFSWQGRNWDGGTQSVIARVEKRRLIWEFRGFFRQGDDRSLVLQLSSTPLIPGEWAHHRIRFKSSASDPGRSGASPGLLEYLVDGIPADMVHANPDGREGVEVFSPRIGSLSDQPIRIAPSFSGYIDEIRLASSYASRPPAGGYADWESAASGVGRTEPVDTGYPDSRLTGMRVRVEMPGSTRVRFYAKSMGRRDEARDPGFPDPADPSWREMRLSPEPEDPMGFGRWYSWKTEEQPTGRYFVVGYVLDPDPGADLAPVLSALEVEYSPKLPPRPPRDMQWDRGDDGRVRISWSPDAEDDVAGWWISWGPRPGDYAATDGEEDLRGSAWIPRDGRSDLRPSFTWPRSLENQIIYTSLRAAWSGGVPEAGEERPADFRALSAPTQELNFRP